MTRLQAERQKRGLSQTALAASAGKLSTSDICRFERGYGRPYPAQARRLAQVLGLDVNALLETASEPSDGAPDRTLGTS
jgi:transcriptional regulator with XRE-family HTH domain